jgi:hypothetical protein
MRYCYSRLHFGIDIMAELGKKLGEKRIKKERIILTKTIVFTIGMVKPKK